jgi:hypothetical protein
MQDILARKIDAANRAAMPPLVPARSRAYRSFE